MYRVSRRLKLIPVLISVLFVALQITTNIEPIEAKDVACFHFSATVGPSGVFSVTLIDVAHGTFGIIETGIRIAPNTVIERTYTVTNNTGIALGTDLVSVVGGLKNGEVRKSVNGTGGSVEEVSCLQIPTIQDGRLNKFDLAALGTIYQSNDGYDIWEINPTDSKGSLVFSVPIEDVLLKLVDVETTGANKLIGANKSNTITFWALKNAQCQLNYVSQDGQTREFTFNCLVPFADRYDEILAKLNKKLGL